MTTDTDGDRATAVRKQSVLTHATPSQVASISDAVTIKDGPLYCLFDKTAMIPLHGSHGFGLYFRDCRYLCGYELTLAGQAPDVLAATAAAGSSATFQMTNPRFRLPDDTVVEKERIGIRWQRVLDADTQCLRELLRCRNFGAEPLHLPLRLEFDADFTDIFVVRGLADVDLGHIEHAGWSDDALRFRYSGSDGRLRSTTIRVQPAPARKQGTCACFELDIGPQETIDIEIVLAVREWDSDETEAADPDPGPIRDLARRQETAVTERMDAWTRIETDSILLNQVLDRCLRDMAMLRTPLRGETYAAAGVPWFVTLFGRDAAVSSLQTLAFDPNTAGDTLRLLARLQSDQYDDWRDAEPGKILQQIRIGELANRGVIPHTPYYGSVDATPLFLILLARHAAWTDGIGLFNELREHVERALEWLDSFAHPDGDGFIDYDSPRNGALINQGWKDSGTAIVDETGAIAHPPIALIEVQGYAFRARQDMATLFQRTGDDQRAHQLRRQAGASERQVDTAFWMEDKDCYALALQGADRVPARVVTSNAGHVLWAGAAPRDRALRVKNRLLADDMFSGWGVRTLSSECQAYNPVGYHLGTVWPHDNSMIAAGFRRYRLDDGAVRIFEALVDLASSFQHGRTPEVISGFQRDHFGVPVRYPVACHPHAWAAGSVPYVLMNLLGLTPQGSGQRLHIVRPILPSLVDVVELHGLRVADASVDLRFRKVDGTVAVEILDRAGDLEVLIEPA